MADKKISELDAITGANTAADDYFVVVDTSGSVTKKISRAELNNAIEQDVLAQVSITDLGSDLNTNGNDINFGDNDKATFGSGDLEIYHDSLNSYIVDSGTGDLIVQGGNNVFIKDGSGNNMLRTTDGAQVRLYYGNATRLDTTATGVDVTGTVVADTLSLNSSTDFGIGTISSDTNWGMYLRSDNVGGSDPANADFNFASNANENRLRIGSGGDISFYDSTGVSQGLFWDASTQRLGLGTTTPTHELTVSAANDSGIRIDAEGNNVALMLTDETTSNGFRLNYNAPSDVLSFDTTNGTGAKVSERMRIDSSGNVGIGTAPAGGVQLDVRGTGVLQLVNTDTVQLLASSGGSTLKNVSNNPLLFGTNNAERMRIDSSGNVGIGMTNPNSYGRLAVMTPTTGYGYFGIGNSVGGGGGVNIGSYFGTARVSYMDTAVENGTAGSEQSRLTFGTASGGTLSEKMRIDSSGSVKINTTSTIHTNAILNAHMTESSGTVVALKRDPTAGARQITFHNPNGEVGNIQTSGSGTSYNTSSDYRLKENVTAITSATDRLNQLNPVRFNFIADADTTVDGFLAHEAQAVVPEAVTGTHNEVDDDGDAVMQGIDQSKLVPLLTAALQEALTKIDQLETRITALEA